MGTPSSGRPGAAERCEFSRPRPLTQCGHQLRYTLCPIKRCWSTSAWFVRRWSPPHLPGFNALGGQGAGAGGHWFVVGVRAVVDQRLEWCRLRSYRALEPRLGKPASVVREEMRRSRLNDILMIMNKPSAEALHQFRVK